MNHEPLVSVVTPVYNGAAFLEECVLSILNQTYSNWELTIVDNASTDATPDIASRYASLDARIHHERFEVFVDATENHNRAFRVISPESEFCKVVQADDWIFPECLTRMVAAAASSEKIGVVSAYRLWNDTVDLVGLPYQQTFSTGHDVLRQSLLGGAQMTGGPTALLLRSAAVRARGHSFYLPGFQHEDTEAVYWLLLHNDFGYVHQVLTYARRQPGANLEKAGRVNTYIPETIRCLLRYGPLVLGPDAYRARLRGTLRNYVRFHIRQFPKPSRLRDPRFFSMHLAEVESIEAESGGDRDVKAALLIVKALLLRGVWHGRTPATLGGVQQPAGGE